MGPAGPRPPRPGPVCSYPGPAVQPAVGPPGTGGEAGARFGCKSRLWGLSREEAGWEGSQHQAASLLLTPQPPTAGPPPGQPRCRGGSVRAAREMPRNTGQLGIPKPQSEGGGLVAVSLTPLQVGGPQCSLHLTGSSARPPPRAPRPKSRPRPTPLEGSNRLWGHEFALPHPTPAQPWTAPRASAVGGALR